MTSLVTPINRIRVSLKSAVFAARFEPNFGDVAPIKIGAGRTGVAS
jgi:hypothetical protein